MIKFGPEGWAARLSAEFTFDNVRKAAKAIAVFLISRDLAGKPFLVSYDPRFQADKFALEIVKLLEAAGITVFLTERDTPTPIVAWETVDKGAAGAVVITAGSLGAQFCGLKFLRPGGAPCLADCIKEIETYLYLEKSATLSASLPNQTILNYQSAVSQIGRGKKGAVTRFEPRERYYNYLAAQIDRSKLARRVVIDPLYGAARGYVDLFLQRLGCDVEVLHGKRDVLFGGCEPNPIAENLVPLQARVAELKADLGIAFNADASRFALIGREGKYQAGQETVDPILTAVSSVAQRPAVL
jgi:phosphomannomutase